MGLDSPYRGAQHAPMRQGQSAETVQEEGLVGVLRTAFAPLGFASVLDGLPKDADKASLMRRLVEMGPGLQEDGKKAEPTLPLLQANVIASKIMGGDEGEFLRSRATEHVNKRGCLIAE